jgi:hypothetical protein
MGCDYYIVKALEIDFNYSISSRFIELERNSGYFNFDLDEDDPNFDTLYKEYIYETLEPGMDPILIYEEGDFTSKKIELKYKEMVEIELLKLGKAWTDVRKICKIEYSYERE